MRKAQNSERGTIAAIEDYINALDDALFANGMHDHSQRLSHIEEMADNLLFSKSQDPELKYGPVEDYAEQLIEASGTSRKSLWWRPLLALIAWTPFTFLVGRLFTELPGRSGDLFDSSIEFTFFDITFGIFQSLFVAGYQFPRLNRASMRPVYRADSQFWANITPMYIFSMLVLIGGSVLSFVVDPVEFATYQPGWISSMALFVSLTVCLGLAWLSGWFDLVVRVFKTTFRPGAVLTVHQFSSPLIRISKQVTFLPPSPRRVPEPDSTD